MKDGIYFPLDVEIIMLNGEKRICKVYQQTTVPKHVSNIENLPTERRPSKIYLNTIQLGAKESALPIDYQEFLKRVPHNGYEGTVDIKLNLNVID